MKLARASVGYSAEDGAGAAVDDLAKVHGDGEQENEEEDGEVEKCVEELGEVIHWKEEAVHPEEDEDGENGEHSDDDAGDAF